MGPLVFALLLPAALQEEPGNALGGWNGVRPALEEHGVTTTLTWTADLLSNVHGGLETGARYESLFDLILDADLAKAAGWTGGRLHFDGLRIEGEGLSERHVGDLTKVSNIDARDEFRVYEAWVQQEAFDRKVLLRGGLLAADAEFAVSDAAALFLNGSLGMPVGISANVPIAVYPLGAVGVLGRVDPTETFGLQGAVFEGDPGSEEFNDTGARVRLTDGEGTLTILEGEARSGDVVAKAGGYYHRESYGGVYGLVEGRLEGLTGFLRAAAAPRGRSLVSEYADAGLTWTGLLPGRDRDVLGLAVVYARIGEDFAGDREFVVELTYRAQIERWLFVQPDLQVVLHPGGDPSVDDAVVLGLRVEVTF